MSKSQIRSGTIYISPKVGYVFEKFERQVGWGCCSFLEYYLWPVTRDVKNDIHFWDLDCSSSGGACCCCCCCCCSRYHCLFENCGWIVALIFLIPPSFEIPPKGWWLQQITRRSILPTNPSHVQIPNQEWHYIYIPKSRICIWEIWAVSMFLIPRIVSVTRDVRNDFRF